MTDTISTFDPGMADQPETELLRSYRSILDHCLLPYLRVMRYRDSLVGTMMSGIEAVRDHQLEQLRKERDQAIAHDRQPYPTQWAYDQACAALETHRARADAAEAINDRIAQLHGGPRTERHGSGCVQCGILWPCPTKRALDGEDTNRG
ncbi:hypothetical protein [Nonomuraea sp. NPDC049709]|uniref:hypothetical protein n=1 Tax=Nonomuraea sp. NPDC049709 TaxID=3154736 RepID=UPI003442CE71